MAVSLRKRGKSYAAYWREDGKLITKSLGKDHRAAKIKMADIEKNLMAKKNGTNREIAWDEFKDKYIKCCETDLSKETVIRIKVVFNNFDKVLTIRRLSDLTPEVFEEFKTIRKNIGVMATTINRELQALKASMKKAAEWGYASANVWGVRKLPTVKKRPVFFTEQDLVVLLDKAEPFWKTVIYIGFYAGLRMGEMLNLEWTDVDFHQRILKVTPTEHWHPKDREAREVPLHPELEEHLKLWKKISSGTTKILPWNQKKNIFSRTFAKVRKRSELEQGSVHTLRHSFASHMAMRGIDLNRIREMMGHSSIVTTQIYAHLLPSSLRDAVVVLPRLGAPASADEAAPLTPAKNGKEIDASLTNHNGVNGHALPLAAAAAANFNSN